MSISAAILTSLLCLGVMFRRPRRASGLAYISAYIFYFCIGPILGFWLTGWVYKGTVRKFIPEVATLYAVVFLALTVADFFFNRSMNKPHQRTVGSEWNSWTFKVGLVLTGTYAVLNGLRIFVLSPGDKVVAISVAGPFHYQFLLVAAMLAAGGLAALHSHKISNWYLIFFFSAYLLYCMVTGERDFIFILFSILIHHLIIERSARAFRLLVIGGSAAVLGGSLLFALRGGEHFDLAIVLGQGSTLFIDTFVLDWLDGGGSAVSNSYVQFLQGRDATAVGSWSEWLSYMYTGTTNSGAEYGFSLIGEAYINGRTLGVFALFLILGIVVKYAQVRSIDSTYWLFFSVFLTYMTLYSVRGQAFSFAMAMIYFAVLIVLVRLGDNEGAGFSRSKFNADP